jgi:hypothetical protein
MNQAPVRTPPRKQPGQGCGPRRIAGVALDVRTAAAFIGVTEKALRAQVGRRLVPHRRLGARIIFLRDEVEQWLATLDGCGLNEAQANMAARLGRES